MAANFFMISFNRDGGGTGGGGAGGGGWPICPPPSLDPQLVDYRC